MGRCFLNGEQGDAMNTILAGFGLNLRKLLRYLRHHPFLRPILWVMLVPGRLQSSLDAYLRVKTSFLLAMCPLKLANTH